MNNIYIAAQFKDAELVDILLQRINKVYNELNETKRLKPWELTFDWPKYGEIKDEPEKMPWLATKEIEAVKKADIFGFITPGGRGAHVELGVALALNKPVIMYDKGMDDKYDYPCLFHEYPNIYKVGECPKEFAYMVRAVADINKTNPEPLDTLDLGILRGIRTNSEENFRYFK